MSTDDSRIIDTLQADRTQLGEILETFRGHLRTMIRLRIDPRVRRRIDTSDVLQDAFVEIAERLERYLEKPDMPFFPWIRFITGQRLLKLHRQHLRVEKRDARREVYLARMGTPEASSIALAEALIDRAPSPSQVAARAEELVRLRAALEELRPLDREVLSLRHFEGLGNSEVALILGIQPKAASIRYVRALGRLGSALGIRYVAPEKKADAS